MALLSQTKTQVREKTFFSPEVPDDDRAKLMYYLKTVLDLVDNQEVTDPAVARLLNYRDFVLTRAEMGTVVDMCLRLKPDILVGKVIIIDAAACRDEDHRYIEITRVTNNVLLAGPLIINGEERQVRKILAIKREWLDKYYFIPIKRHLVKTAVFDAIFRGVEQMSLRQQEQQQTRMLAIEDRPTEEEDEVEGVEEEEEEEDLNREEREREERERGRKRERERERESEWKNDRERGREREDEWEMERERIKEREGEREREKGRKYKNNSNACVIL